MLRNIWLTISIKKKIGIFAAMVILIMAAKIPIFLFMEIVIHSFLREGRMITSCCNSYVSFFMSFVAF